MIVNFAKKETANIIFCKITSLESDDATSNRITQIDDNSLHIVYGESIVRGRTYSGTRIMFEAYKEKLPFDKF